LHVSHCQNFILPFFVFPVFMGYASIIPRHKQKCQSEALKSIAKIKRKEKLKYLKNTTILLYNEVKKVE